MTQHKRRRAEPEVDDSIRITVFAAKGVTVIVEDPLDRGLLARKLQLRIAQVFRPDLHDYLENGLKALEQMEMEIDDETKDDCSEDDSLPGHPDPCPVGPD